MKDISNNIRKSLLKATSKSNSSHSGTALSVVDILAVLYFKVMNIDPKAPEKKDRDKFLRDTNSKKIKSHLWNIVRRSEWEVKYNAGGR